MDNDILTLKVERIYLETLMAALETSAKNRLALHKKAIESNLSKSSIDAIWADYCMADDLLTNIKRQLKED